MTKLRAIGRTSGSDPHVVDGLPCPRCRRHRVAVRTMDEKQRRELQRSFADPIPRGTIKGPVKCSSCHHELSMDELNELVPLIHAARR